MKIKSFIFLLAAFFLSAQISLASIENNGNETAKTSSTTTLNGQVTDAKTGEALVGVLIKIDGTDQTVYTDFDGNFTLNNISKEEHKISAELVSYKKCEGRKLNTKNEGNIQIKLEQLD